MRKRDQRREKNAAWNPNASPKQGWWRAEQWFPMGMCEECKTKPAKDRHHKDNNPLNNDPANVMRLCRRCHMKIDGRLEKVRQRMIELKQKQMKEKHQ